MTRTWLVVTKNPVREDEWDPLDIEMGVTEVHAPTQRDALTQALPELRRKHPNYFISEANPFSQIYAELISHCNECQREFHTDESFVVPKNVPYNANRHLCGPCHLELKQGDNE
jgi:hypothetical protein